MSQSVAILRKVGGLVFDATFSEKHEVSAEITQNPVETGVNIADHMFMKPRKVTISAGVSDTPLRPIAGDQFSGGSSRSQKAYDLLTKLQASFEPFNIQTGLKLYENFICKNVACEQDKDTPNVFVFEAELEEVIFVSTQMVVLPPLAAGPTKRQAGSPVQRGNVQPTTVTDPQKQQELMDQITGATFVNSFSTVIP